MTIGNCFNFFGVIAVSWERRKEGRRKEGWMDRLGWPLLSVPGS